MTHDANRALSGPDKSGDLPERQELAVLENTWLHADEVKLARYIAEKGTNKDCLDYLGYLRVSIKNRIKAWKDYQ